MESGRLDGGGFLVAGGDAAPLLQSVDAPFDSVALPVGLAVEGRWPAVLAAPAESMPAPVCGDGDHRSVQALERDIRAWLADRNEHLRPFI
ncbi:hypothetical protein ACFQ7A_18735 [Streptomyces sp. NPDC056528]|uniref:hypothetical protein n=1 Tax=Streptomyces sp. NPDC056528 TaxID=3345854 RepID=UPI00367EC0D3